MPKILKKSPSNMENYHFDCAEITAEAGEVIDAMRPHKNIEFFFCSSGSFCVERKNGEKTVLHCGDLLILPAKTEHKATCTESGVCIFLKVAFDLLLSPSLNVFETKYILPFLNPNTTLQMFFTPQNDQTNRIARLFADILQETLEELCMFELAVKTHIHTLIVLIARHWWTTNQLNVDIQDISRNALNKLDFVLPYIENNYANPLTVKKLAHRVNISYSYFSKMFKAGTGCSFTDYVNKVRLKKAEQMLLVPSASITHVAMNCGFNSTSYFIKLFKQKNGITPIQFQEKYKQFPTPH